MLVSPAAASGRLGPHLEKALAATGAAGPFLVWVRLADRPTRQPTPNLVTPRSLQRRAKVLPASRLLGPADLPLDEPSVSLVAERVERLRHRSKWFNAVSALATRSQIEALQSLSCVRSIELVGRWGRRASAPQPVQSSPVPKAPPPGTTALDYGPSVGQLQQINVPAVHDRGLHGEGVLIGHFDDGYRLLSHQALTNLNIVATRDFVDPGIDPAPPVSSPSFFGAHGIATLSALAGYAPGQLVGPAYGADFLLARTEDDGSETPLEEDNWVAAIEWADSLGVDIVSSSVGYDSYNPPYQSWTWEDMDGNTTVITQAADMAVERGIVVFNAAGNSGLNPAHNTLVAPADGDSVITVGGVESNGNRYTSSSVGPTASTPPRVKPDVMAQGALVYAASSDGPAVYGPATGTSLACPLAAGVGALLLQAQPNATPMQIREALRMTASRATTPDNLYGWGIIDAEAALDYLTTAVRATSWTTLKGRYR